MTFASDVSLALPAGDSNGILHFRLHEAVAAPPGHPHDPVVQEIGDEWTVVRVYESGEVEILWRDWLSLRIDPTGRNVSYRVHEDRYPTAFSSYIANFAISAALMLQGEEPLHATVVELHGRGIGLLGSSGAGKSTLAAYLLAQGGELVTDDMLRITESDGRMFAEPGQPRLKLFRETAERFLEGAINQGRWNPVSEKYLFDTGDPVGHRLRRGLDGLFFLAPPQSTEAEHVSVRRLEGLELFRVVTGSTMNSKVQTPNRLARQLAFTQRVAERLPVHVLSYPRRHDVLPEVLEAIRTCLA